MTALEERLGYAFGDPALLARALTHRSHNADHNERLEFVGDAVLNCVVALALYRAAQEGFTNALRHGQARRLSLRVDVDADAPGPGPGVRLSLRDDGCGLPPSGLPGCGHHGLRWLAERVEGLRGTLQVGNVEPHGVLLQVAVPVPADCR